MDKNNQKANKKQFHTITKFCHLTFTPDKVYNDLESKKQIAKSDSNILSIISSYLPWKSRSSTKSSLNSQVSSIKSRATSSQLSSEIDSTNSQDKVAHQLKYCLKISQQHILVGNQNQLNLLSISNASRVSFQPQKLWKININKTIDLINVDIKKCIISVANRSSKKLFFYKYSLKKIKKTPHLIATTILSKTPNDLFFIKDNLIILYDKSLEIISVTNDGVVQKKLYQQYFSAFGETQVSNMNFFRAPNPIDSTLNIFFAEQNVKNRLTFTLWVLEIEIFVNDIKMKNFQKVYDIKSDLKNKMILKNFKKDIFWANIGWEILVFQKGYVIDSISISSSIDHSNLRYLCQQRLAHISDHRLELYQIKLSTESKPFRIKAKSLDSIFLNVPADSQFFTVLQVFNNNCLVIFQKNKDKISQNGNLDYWVSLTQPITLKAKFDEFFENKKLADLNGQDLQNYFDISKKMGLSEREIYLELWSRSSKTEIDFSYLLNTKDHILINQELTKILKRHSLPFTQIYKLNRNAYLKLQQELLENPTRQKFFGLISLSFLLKKLQYFKQVRCMQRGEQSNQAEELERIRTPKLKGHGGGIIKNQRKNEKVDSENTNILMVSIKTYNQIHEIHLIQTLVRLIEDYIKNKKPVLNRIKVFLNVFKYPLRMVYKDVLTEIIKSLEKDFKVLLEKIPQILPYNYSQIKQHGMTGYLFLDSVQNQGIWEQLSNFQKENAMCLDLIANIENKQMISQAVKQIRFRRSFLTGHVFIAENNKKIQQNYEYLKSQQIFYYVIEEILKYVAKINDRKAIFTFIQQKYSEKLTHLKNKINLYYQIYHYLEMKNIVPQIDGKIMIFNKFLCLRDFQLFYHLFQIEKNRKGLLLNQIKPIYDQNSLNKTDLFNHCLLDYFKQPISQLSDIKYILNRINNEKKQFHLNNQFMYEILVEAMLWKLKVGSQKDIPVQQVLIYIENFQMKKNSEILSKLQLIKKVGENIQIITDARVNMSLKQIIDNPNLLMRRLSEHMILESQINKKQELNYVTENCYLIIAKLQYIYNEIYNSSEETLFYIFIIFLVKLADYQMFQYIKILINDKYLLQSMEKTAQSISQILGFYLFRMSMTEKPGFVENSNYLKNLITIFPEHNSLKQLIICQFQYAKRLSNRNYQVKYPLSSNFTSPGARELQASLSHLDAQTILKVDVDELHGLMIKMKDLSITLSKHLNSFQQTERSQLLQSVIKENKKPQIRKKQIYEEFILKLLSLKKIKEVIPYINRYLNEEEVTTQDIVYVFMFLMELQDNLNVSHRQLLFKLGSNYFNDPRELFRIIKQFIITPFNTKQRTQFLKKQVKKCQSNQEKSYLINKVLNKNLVQIAIKNGLEKNLKQLLEKSYLHIINSRAQFAHFTYGFIFIMLINDPYVLSKYLKCSKKIVNIKNIRMFLHFLTKQPCFNPIALMQIGSRIFLSVLYSLNDEKQIKEVVSIISQYELDESLPQDFYKVDYDNSIDFFNKLYKNSLYFHKQMNKISQSMKIENDSQNTIENYHYQTLLKPELIMDEKPIQISQNQQSQFGDTKTFVMQIKKDTSFNQSEQINKILQKIRKSRKRRSSAVIQKSDCFKIIEQPFKKKQKEKKSQQLDLESESQNTKQIQEDVEDFSQVPSELPTIRVNLTTRQNHKNKNQQQKEIKHYERPEKLFIKNSNKNNQSQPKQQVKNKVSTIIDKSSLNQDPSQGDKGQFDFKKNEQKIQQLSPLLKPQNKKAIQQAIFESLKKKNSDSLKKNSSQDRSVKSFDRKSSNSDQKNPNQNSFKKKFIGFPSIQQSGLKLCRNNIYLLNNPKIQKFKANFLSAYEKMPEFQEYLKQVIKYLYYQSSELSLVGLMKLIAFLIDSFKLKIDKVHLQIWVRAENLSKKYKLGLDIRKIIPIEAIFQRKVNEKSIFTESLEKLKNIIDDLNIYKIAKMISLTFQDPEFQYKVIYAYACQLLFSFEFQTQKQFGQSTDNYEEQKIEVLFDKLKTSIIYENFDDIYTNTKQKMKPFILKTMVNKIKKDGTVDQKLTTYCKAAEIDKLYEPIFTILRKTR